MSWFNLNVNESLNTLKGQISNVSNVVHDVLTETITDHPQPSDNSTSNDDVLIGLETANKRIDELNALCETKDTEVRTPMCIFTHTMNAVYAYLVQYVREQIEFRYLSKLEILSIEEVKI